MDDETLTTLERSENPDELRAAAIRLARSTQAEAPVALRRHLESDGFLLRIDDATAYEEFDEDLKVAEVIEALAQNRSPAARELLDALTGSRVYLAEPMRVEALLVASADVLPPTSTLTEFWEQHAQPETGFTITALEAMLANGSDVGVRLFEKQILNPAHSMTNRAEWLHVYVCQMSNEKLMLECAERLLRGSELPAELRRELIDALFDFKPFEWFGSLGSEAPAPRRADADDVAKQVLRRIADYVLEHEELTDDQKSAVDRTVASLG